MEHKPLSELEAIADVKRTETVFLTREQRLQRWIEALAAQPNRLLRPLYEIEYCPPEDRRGTRADNSPLSVAYEDPVLRAQGLQSDRVGDCMDFFAITEHQMHYAFCSCHIGSSFKAKEAADRLRRLLPAKNIRQIARGVAHRIGEFLSGRSAAQQPPL
jgi:hypothetical protein